MNNHQVTDNKKKSKSFKSFTILIVALTMSIYTLVGLLWWFSNKENNINPDNKNPGNHTTYTGESVSPPQETMPENPREYLDYITKNNTGVYIEKILSNRPNMSNGTKEQNSSNMHDYIHKNRLEFEIPDNDKKGYIMFVLNEETSNDIFFGMDGKTIGWLNKDRKIFTSNPKEYLYELGRLELWGYDDYSFSVNLNKRKIYINAVAAGGTAKVEKIIIFFK